MQYNYNMANVPVLYYINYYTQAKKCYSTLYPQPDKALTQKIPQPEHRLRDTKSQ